MKSEFTTCNAKEISVYPSSNIHYRVWLKITDDLNDTHIATELSKWDCAILIATLIRAKEYLEEREQ